MEGLHPARLEMLRFLARRVGGGGGVPSQREIGRAMGFSSSQTAAHHLGRLEEEGYIERGSAPSRKRRPMNLTEKGWEAVGEVPVLGRIAAGRGMEALLREGDVLSLPAGVVMGRGGKRRFLLEAHGQSMIGAGIAEGDLLLIEEDESPPDGAVVAAMLVGEGGGGEEVTVKRLFREGRTVRLRAENGGHEDIVAPAEEVLIQGRVEWILRRPGR